MAVDDHPNGLPEHLNDSPRSNKTSGDSTKIHNTIFQVPGKDQESKSNGTSQYKMSSSHLPYSSLYPATPSSTKDSGSHQEGQKDAAYSGAMALYPLSQSFEEVEKWLQEIFMPVHSDQSSKPEGYRLFWPPTLPKTQSSATRTGAQKRRRVALGSGEDGQSEGFDPNKRPKLAPQLGFSILNRVNSPQHGSQLIWKSTGPLNSAITQTYRSSPLSKLTTSQQIYGTAHSLPHSYTSPLSYGPLYASTSHFSPSQPLPAFQPGQLMQSAAHLAPGAAQAGIAPQSMIGSSQSMLSKRSNYLEIRRRLGMGEYFNVGGDCTVQELAMEYGIPSHASFRTAAKIACEKYWNDQNPLHWTSEWIKLQYIILKKPMPPKQFVGDTGKQCRIGQIVEDCKIALSELLSAWKAEQEDCAHDKKALERRIRSFPANMPLLPKAPHHVQVHALQIALLHQYHPWFLSLGSAQASNQQEDTMNGKEHESQASSSSLSGEEHMSQQDQQILLAASRPEVENEMSTDGEFNSGFQMYGNDDDEGNYPDDISSPTNDCSPAADNLGDLGRSDSVYDDSRFEFWEHGRDGGIAEQAP